MNSMFVSKQEMWTSSACSLSHTKSALLCCQWRIMQQASCLQWKGGLGLGTCVFVEHTAYQMVTLAWPYSVRSTLC